MINQQDKDLFDRFRCRTLYSLGSSEVVEIYNSYILDASFSVSSATLRCLQSPSAHIDIQCPFLMHGMLAVTAVHDRYLGVTSPTRRSIQESYHWSQCTVEFNKFIRQPIQERHKDPIWATAGITAVLTFASINSSPSEETWPLGAPDSSDLEWLRWGAAKMTLWQLVDPQRPNSVFRSMAETLASMRRRLPTAGTDGVWAELRDLCGLTDSSNQENSPYFSAAHSLSRLLDMPPDEPPQGRVMTVLGHMHRQFGTCLEKKDPVALLMLCLWYTRAREAYWWIDLRARQELPAICAYLQRYHKDDRAIQCLVPWDEAMTITY